jgi:hypothetical protein
MDEEADDLSNVLEVKMGMSKEMDQKIAEAR